MVREKHSCSGLLCIYCHKIIEQEVRPDYQNQNFASLTMTVQLTRQSGGLAVWIQSCNGQVSRRVLMETISRIIMVAFREYALRGIHDDRTLNACPDRQREARDFD